MDNLLPYCGLVDVRINASDKDCTKKNPILTLKEAGGGPKRPTGQETVCHFSHGHAMVTKILDFIHKHVY